MQTPDNPDYYLKHGFDKAYSNYGVPYIDEGCAPGLSNNIVIYGHHMNDGTMFADLCGYADRGFYEGHKTIRFDTLSGSGEYEVVAAFRFNTNRDTFRYNEYTNMDEAEFAEFLENVRARALYDTDMEVEYGDTLLTLSTCEYTYKNGPEKRQDRSADLQSGYQDGGGHGKSHEGGSADLRQGGPHHGTGRKNGSPNPCRCCKSSCESHRVRRQGHCRSG